jgi:hypothetical protein
MSKDIEGIETCCRFVKNGESVVYPALRLRHSL